MNRGTPQHPALTAAAVAPEVFAMRPDYRALLMVVEGIEPGASDDRSEQLLVYAEARAEVLLADTPVDQLPHIAAWREAYRAFGAKPQRTRNSAEALLRRAAGPGLPRVNRLTDIYNAISVLHQLPLGGEDADCYQGPPRLLRSDGTEPFDTTANGERVIEHPEIGEVVWCDDAGVTCRRWNWRQAQRTQLRDTTCSALFILDALQPMTDEELSAAADVLATEVTRLGTSVTISSRVLRG